MYSHLADKGFPEGNYAGRATRPGKATLSALRPIAVAAQLAIGTAVWSSLYVSSAYAQTQNGVTRQYEPPPVSSASGSDAALPAVTVTDTEENSTYAGGQVARRGAVGLLGNQDFMDTPFSITTYTAEQIENVQARRLTDIVADDPAVRDGRGVAYYDQFAIRGFPVYASDVSYDGVYGVLPWFGIPSDIAERVEILKGATQLLTGMSPDGTVGGSINIVPKRAGDQPLTRVSFDYESRGEYGTHLDLSRRFGQDGEFGVRFNGVLRNGDQPWDRSSQTFGLASLGLDYKGRGIRLSADMGYQANRIKAPISENLLVNSGFQIPSAPSATSNAEQDWNYIRDRSMFGLLKGEFDLNDDWTVTAALGGNRMDFLYSQSTQTITDASGNIDLGPYYYAQHWNTWSGQLGLRGHLKTGSLKHTLNIQASEIDSTRSLAAENLPGYSSNIYAPSIVAQTAVFPTLPSYSDLPKWSTQKLSSVALSDSISLLDDQLQLILGGRQQRVLQIGYDSTTGEESSRYDSTRFSPAAAIVMKLSDKVSLFANYIEGLSPGAQAPAGTTNAGQIFAPYVSRQNEAGVKVDFGRIASTLSIDQITQPSAFTDAATNTFRVDGRQRNRGLELQTFGEATRGVRVLGGLAITYGRLTKTADGAYDGNTAPGVPVRQLNLSTEWDTPFVTGLTLTGRVVNTSKQYYDQANTQSIPDWTRIDLGARYTTVGPWQKPLVFRFNVNNVANLAYWSSTNGGSLARGAPRTFLLSVALDL